MLCLVLGVLLWSAVHFLPGAAAPLRQRCIGRLGEGPYKGLFTLLLFAAIALMVMGWKETLPSNLYGPPVWGRVAANGLMLLALLLFAVSALPSNLKRFVRHPQLAGVAVWGGGHLLANGDQRSLVFFGGFALWALVEMLLINRRDGPWERPAPVPLRSEWMAPLAAGAAYVALFLAHPYLFGVSVAP